MKSLRFHKAVGCRRCGGSGYRGRTGIYEVMVISDEIRKMILLRSSADEISRVAESQGMVRLRDDGLLKAAKGHNDHRRSVENTVDCVIAPGDESMIHFRRSRGWPPEDEMITQSGLGDYLLDAANMGASDLHITAGLPPMVRISGKVEPLDYPPLTANATRDLIYDLLSNDQRQRLENEWELDFSYALPRSARFRVNVYFQRGAIGAAFRTIPSEIMSISELGLPKAVEEPYREAARARPGHGPDGKRQIDHPRRHDRQDQRDQARAHHER